MASLLDDAIKQTKRTPDLVLTGHVHNYQRFSRHLDRGRQLPYIVAGAGGYWHLHYMAKDVPPSPLSQPFPIQGTDLTIEQCCDDRHGYLRLTITKTGINGVYTTVPRPQESWRHGPTAQLDRFTINLKMHKVV